MTLISPPEPLMVYLMAAAAIAALVTAFIWGPRAIHSVGGDGAYGGALLTAALVGTVAWTVIARAAPREECPFLDVPSMFSGARTIWELAFLAGISTVPVAIVSAIALLVWYLGLTEVTRTDHEPRAEDPGPGWRPERPWIALVLMGAAAAILVAWFAIAPVIESAECAFLD